MVAQNTYLRSLFCRWGLILSGFALCWISITGCTSLVPESIGTWGDGLSTSGQDGQNSAGNASEMLALINTARSESRMCGSNSFDAAPPLQWDADLEEAARIHNEDMTTNVFSGHEGSDGSSSMQRVRRIRTSRVTAVGETISYFASDNAHAVERWLNSPGHCSILMDATFTHMGADTARGPRFNAPDHEGDYRTAVYGRF